MPGMCGEIITELQSRGVRVGQGILHRKGGAGPAEAGFLLIGGIPVSVPVHGPYVSNSPYAVEKQKGQDLLLNRGEVLFPVDFVPRPRFYDHSTGEGIPYPKIALLHGKDCLATSVDQRCVYWPSRLRCRFCGIELSLKDGQTIARKTPEQLAEVAQKARALDGVTHVVLTTGAAAGAGVEIKRLAACAKAIKGASGLAVHAQFMPPEEEEDLRALKRAGVDTVGIHVESFDLQVLERAAPAKAAIGLNRYKEAWKRSVEIFGTNQVSTFLLVGLGERSDSLLEGCEILADLGVYPFLVPLRPIPGTLMEKALPPSPRMMTALYHEVARILRRKGLSSARSQAGCVRCGACSALPAFEGPADRLVCHPARTAGELMTAYEIRRQVFVLEQGLFQDSDKDGEDRKSIHLVAEKDGEVVGTVRVFPSSSGNGHWIGGRLAVKGPFRACGAGELLVKDAVACVKKRGCTSFTAHVQQENVPFFTQLGWRAIEPVRAYRGRPHQLMEANLDAPDPMN